jgi:hypothetical protein
MSKIVNGNTHGPYSTNCNCKNHYFPEIKSAILHYNNCSKTTEIIYHSPYTKDIIVRSK